MAITVAPTTYETKVDKKLATVDVYAEAVKTNPVNNETKQPVALANNKLENFTPNETNKLLSDKLNTFKDKTVSLKQALDKIGSVVKNPKDFTDNLTKGILTDTLKSVGYKGNGADIASLIKNGPNSSNLLDMLGNSNPNVKVIVGDVEKIISSKDLGSVTGIASLISELTGNANLIKILNISPKLAVVKSFIDQAMKLRLPEVIDLLMDTMDSEEDLRQLKLHSCLNAAMNSDIGFILKQLNDRDIGRGAIVSLYPNLVSIILENYRLDHMVVTPNDVSVLIQVLSRLDPKWLVYNRNGTEIDDISKLAKASDDALRVLKKNNATYVPALLARSTEGTDMVTTTLNMRPYTPASVLKI